MEFSYNLKLILKKYNIKNSDLAEILGVSASQITHYKKGVNQFNVQQFEQVGEYLDLRGVSDDDLELYVKSFITLKTGIDPEESPIIKGNSVFRGDLSPFENQLLKKFRRLDPVGQNEVFELVDSLERQNGAL